MNDKCLKKQGLHLEKDLNKDIFDDNDIAKSSRYSKANKQTEGKSLGLFGLIEELISAVFSN